MLRPRRSEETPCKHPTSQANTVRLDHLNSARTLIEWLSQLNTEYHPAKEYRRTSIIGTIGPKTKTVEMLGALRKAGMNIGEQQR